MNEKCLLKFYELSSFSKTYFKKFQSLLCFHALDVNIELIINLLHLNEIYNKIFPLDLN